MGIFIYINLIFIENIRNGYCFYFIDQEGEFERSDIFKIILLVSS